MTDDATLIAAGTAVTQTTELFPSREVVATVPTAKEVRFVVPGEPQGKGRHRSFPLMRNGKAVVGPGGRPVIIQATPEATASYENLVRLAAKDAMEGRAPTRRPVAVEIRAYKSVPKSWSGVRTRRALSDGILPTGKVDIDNLVKAILDGINGVTFDDDARVVDLLVSKRYADMPRVEVTVRELDGESAA